MVWEPLELGMNLTATCDGFGAVTLKIELREEHANSWSMTGSMRLDFGHLPRYAEHADRFMNARGTE
ncbi:DUF6228 family protein [Dinoroseobacter sp. S124A]|uniref:DUF6228 family protein n=1 Tax=Dinoroseobacter sp. S124A TaxID=3415128 RepID=UPI003C79B8FA